MAESFPEARGQRTGGEHVRPFGLPGRIYGSPARRIFGRECGGGQNANPTKCVDASDKALLQAMGVHEGQLRGDVRRGRFMD